MVDFYNIDFFECCFEYVEFVDVVVGGVGGCYYVVFCRWLLSVVYMVLRLVLVV